MQQKCDMFLNMLKKDETTIVEKLKYNILICFQCDIVNNKNPKLIKVVHSSN